MQEGIGFWATAGAVTSVLVNLSILAGVIVAVIKLRVLHILERKYRSELQCTHHAIGNGRVILLADYSIHNTGEMPIVLSSIRLRLHPAGREGVLVMPDTKTLLAERVIESADREKRGLFQLESGERSIFTLRCELPELNAPVFLLCQISWPYRRVPAPYISIYVPFKGATNIERSAG